MTDLSVVARRAAKSIARQIPAVDALLNQRDKLLADLVWLRANSVPMPPAEFRELVSGSPTSEANHIRIGEAVFEMVKRDCQLTPSATVFDIGCGCGRVAVPLSRYLTSGTYHGIDIVKPMVDWCRTAIGSQHSNFHFHHAGLANTLYSKHGPPAADYVFPFKDRTFDAIFATSVFTHLLPSSAQQYLNEIARALKPSGRAMCSFFLQSEMRERRAYDGGSLHRCDGYSVLDKDNPEHIVIFDKPVICKMIVQAGLKIESLDDAPPSNDPADWSKQDTFVVTRG